MTPRQPTFRFFPRAYETDGVFSRTDEPCEVCRQPCTWRYRGIIYVTGRTPLTCASCIGDGRLAEFLKPRGFVLHDIQLEEVDETLADELLQRTPGVPSFNPFHWPVVERVPLVFIGYGDDQRIWGNADARAAIVAAFGELDSNCDGPSPYALVFQTLDSTRYCAVIDFD